MEKLIVDGEVAVAVSINFGAGWSTWNDVNCMDARFNRLFVDGKHEEAAALCRKLDLGYTGGAKDVKIVWVPVGERFEIREFDGLESIKLERTIKWQTA